MKEFISKSFLIFLLISVIFAVYLIFKPFLIEILAATILVTIFYTPFEWLSKKLKGRKNLASLIMCFLISALIIVPLVNFIILGAQKSAEAYTETTEFIERTNLLDSIFEEDGFIQMEVLSKLNKFGFDGESFDFKEFLIDSISNVSHVLDGATSLIKGTTNFFVSLVIIIFTMFFFFIDGKMMLERIMYWTPLPNKYDREIFKKFKDVSYSTVISTFVTAIAQGFVGAIGFIIVGLPSFFAGVFMGIFSLVPYVGTAAIWVPAVIYLLVIGKIWQAIFLAIWGSLVIGSIDNVIRAYIIKGKSQVHPIFIIFSILGGISLFGFWGVILGPLIISLAVTVLHIYEMEYEDVLEK